MSRRVIVTTSWDDNSYENLRIVKLLDEFGLRGTFYINSNSDNMGRSLKQEPTKCMVLEVAKSDHEIGSHTVNHVVLTKCRNPEDEVKVCKNKLEELTKREVHSFCYPFGVYDDRIKNLVREAGYICGRTSDYMPTSFPRDPFEWGISLQASNGSPLTTLKIWRQSRIPLKSIIDWEVRAKLLFDMVLRKGGIWHLWGHSWEIDWHKDWNKLERVMQYVSNRRRVLYLTNREVFNARLTGQ